MTPNGFRFSWFGLTLILVGTALLFDRFGIVDFDFGQVVWSGLLIYGLGHLIRGFGRRSKGEVFWGTLLVLFAFQSLLRSFDLFELHSLMFISTIFIILGISFLAMYLSSLRDYQILIPTILFLGFGVALVLGDLGFIDHHEVWCFLRLFWPIILVFFGLWLLLRRKPTSPVPPS